MSRPELPNPAALQRLSRAALAVLLLTALASAALGFVAPGELVRGLYFAAFSWLGVSLGCAALLFIGDMTGGRWVEKLHPWLDAGRSLLPWMLPLLAMPLLWMGELFPWAGGAVSAKLHEPLEGSKAVYLSPGFFSIRALVYAGVFALLSLWAGDAARNIRLRSLGEERSTLRGSPAGFVCYAFTGIFFITDFVMSLEPHWFSTGLPVILMAGQVFAAYALLLGARCLLSRERGELPPWFGNLLIATMLFWVYVTFVQFLIIWMGNLTEDIGYYLHRSGPLWVGITIFLTIFSFALPFLLLLNRRVKLHPRRLGALALVLFGGQSLHLAWCILPAWPQGWQVGLAALLAWLAIGAFWLWRVAVEAGEEALA